jgi:hypothetical protein
VTFVSSSHTSAQARFSAVMNFNILRTQTLRHNLGIESPHVVCYTLSTNLQIDPALIEIIDQNQVRITFNTATNVRISIL